MQFSITRFRRYAWDLSIAIYELSKEQQLALELKGLKAEAVKARAHFDRLKLAYGKLNETAPAHAADVEGLTEQLSGMQDDLQFAVTTLGNSVGEQEKPPPVVVKADDAVTATNQVQQVAGYINLIPQAPKEG